MCAGKVVLPLSNFVQLSVGGLYKLPVRVIQPYISKERQCPVCDSENVLPLPPRSYEAQSSVTWYQCRKCHHMWHREKPVEAKRKTPARAPVHRPVN
jgi:rubredoxin